jgi:FixJ family two-component response regulator
MIASRPLLCVVDDDESVRESLPDLLQEFGFEVETFASAEEFLASGRIGETRCLIVDVAMPGMSGPDLQRELVQRHHKMPIIFITAHADLSAVPGLFERGAVAWLRKPFSDTALREALDAALASP